MAELKPQGIVDKLNTLTIDKMKVELKIKEYQRALECTSEYGKIENLKFTLQNINKDEATLKDEGKQLLLDSNIKKFEALDGTIIQLNKKPGKLVVEHEDDIGEEYYKTKTTTTLDKKQLKEDITKEGLIVDGVYIEEDYNLVIKNK